MTTDSKNLGSRTSHPVHQHLPRKVNIAFVLWSLAGMGGSEKVVYDIVRNLDSHVFSIIVISLEDGPVRTLYENMGIKVVVISRKNQGNVKFIKRLRNILVENNIEIVNPHHFAPLLFSFLASRFTNIKLVYTEHSRWQLEQLKPSIKILNDIMLFRADILIAISQPIYNYYREKLYIKKNKIHLLTNGIDIDIFKKGIKKNLKNEISCEAQEQILGMVANIRPEKNHKLLIAAFSKVANKRKDIRLILIGQDFMNGEIHEYAAKSEAKNRIHFLGPRDDIPSLLSQFDIFCLPSIYEGMPLSILESMASGVPVVGADVLGIRDVITNEKNGLLFPSNDQKILENILMQLFDDASLRKRLASAGRSFVEKHHSLKNIIKQYQELFLSII